MVVIIDQLPHGTVHWVETDPALCLPVQHPNGSGETGIDNALKHHNDHPEGRDAAGWHEVRQLEGETEPLTRWQRLVRACNHPDATDQAKSLGLKE
jgi:hypothetical protein